MREKGLDKIGRGLGKLHYNSPVILTYTICALIVLGLGYLSRGSITSTLFVVQRGSLLSPLTYIRFFTHILGHANWEHYISNFMVILLIGPMLEEKYGSKRLLFMILFTALITGIINTIFFTTGLLGASGIAFMLILLGSFANVKEGSIPLTVIMVAGLYIGNEIINGMFSYDNISHTTHIIGGMCGGILGYILNKKKIRIG